MSPRGEITARLILYFGNLDFRMNGGEEEWGEIRILWKCGELATDGRGGEK